jgi:hypothetical protein
MNDDIELPNFKLTVMYKILQNVDFRFGIWNVNNIIWHHRYLWDIKLYHTEGKTVYYVGGTWINAGITNILFCKIFQLASCAEGAILKEASKGLKSLSGKGKWLLVVLICKENGFMD